MPEVTNKRPENIQRRTPRAIAHQTCRPTTGGTFQEQTGESAIKGIHISTRLFNNDREEREERKGKEDKDLKGGCKFSLMF